MKTRRGDHVANRTCKDFPESRDCLPHFLYTQCLACNRHSCLLSAYTDIPSTKGSHNCHNSDKYALYKTLVTETKK